MISAISTVFMAGQYSNRTILALRGRAQVNWPALMAKRVVLQLLFALLLLAGQQVALLHSVWHLGKHAPVQRLDNLAGAQNHPAEGKSTQSRLCDLHSTLGTLLAGDCGSLPVSAAITASQELSAYAAAWRATEPATTPPSRAPPVLL